MIRSATLTHPVQDWFRRVASEWNRFWFEPRSAETLGIIRLLTGVMLVYTHAVWLLELETFFGPEGILERNLPSEIDARSPFVWNHYEWIDHPAWRWGTHVVGMVVLGLFAAGCWTRLTGLAGLFFAISCAHRAGGALFGLDQINCMLMLYLAIAPCGTAYSVDAWRRKGRGGESPETDNSPTILGNVATRLIQLHLCVIYLFAGWGKLAGPAWWEGTAIWGAIASHEYQTIPLTFLAAFPLVLNAITFVALFWECSYPFLIWPRLTRPVWILLAIVVHMGIGLCMGMLTFGIIMVVANLAFVEPEQMKRFFSAIRRPASTGAG